MRKLSKVYAKKEHSRIKKIIIRCRSSRINILQTGGIVK